MQIRNFWFKAIVQKKIVLPYSFVENSGLLIKSPINLTDWVLRLQDYFFICFSPKKHPLFFVYNLALGKLNKLTPIICKKWNWMLDALEQPDEIVGNMSKF